MDAIDSEHQTALMAAATEGDLDVVEALLQAGADASHCNEEGTTVLMDALGHLDVMAALLTAGADIDAEDSDGETLLIMAARQADLECVQWLLEHGAIHDYMTMEGHTALQAAYAAHNEQLDDVADIIELLRAADLSSTEDEDISSDSDSVMSGETCCESDLADESSP